MKVISSTHSTYLEFSHAKSWLWCRAGKYKKYLRLSDIFIKVYTGELCTHQAFTSELLSLSRVHEDIY